MSLYGSKVLVEIDMMADVRQSKAQLTITFSRTYEYTELNTSSLNVLVERMHVILLVRKKHGKTCSSIVGIV